MADSEIIIVAPGVMRKDLSYAWKLMGTKEALIASGHAKPEWFPTWLETERRGRVKRTNKLNIDRRQIEVRRPALGPCVVIFRRTDDEQAEYIEAHREEREREREQNQKESLKAIIATHHRQQEKRCADALAQPGGLRVCVMEDLVPNLNIIAQIFGLIDELPVLWRFPKDVRERAREILAELAGLCEESEIMPKRSIVAKADHKFQRFMSRVVPSA